MSPIQPLASFLLDTLLPPLCLHCGAPLECARPGVCPGCLASVEPVESGCARCALPRPAMVDGCRRCAGWPKRFRAVAAVRYAGVSETLVRGLKYAGWRHLADVFAGPMSRAVAPAVQSPAAIVPVPLHPVRRRERGFNQSRLLADALGERTKTPVLAALVRHRFTRPQVGLGRAARRANVTHAFGLAPAVALPAGPVLLVDDVATSGATLSAAAEALLEGGAEQVLGITYALASDRDPT